ncbi:nucleoside hydrolase [Kribbella sp.]|uniref:nucleoside hydrolase n=1 Tax=Kribbella sp. TaxID=1871183 RepID=UPI002D2EF8B7|nr:nucleoside hydrolase [Kribbella sp.]HZX08492.1 nucleoside hydrolase [Kribbella sp.]
MGIRLFIETDLFADVDDVGALAVGLSLQRLGECRIVGIGVNTPSKWGPLAARAVLDHHAVDIPVGRHHRTTEDVAEPDYARTIGRTVRTQPAPLASDLLKDILRQPGEPLTVVSIGFFPNLLRIAREEPDLVRRRVRRCVVMGGVFPGGWEFNVSTYAAETAEFLEAWPTPIDFVGFETASDVITGVDLAATLDVDDPVRIAYESFCGAGTGRPSWDPLTVYVAVHPDWPAFGWSDPGEFTMDGTLGQWRSTPTGRHRHLIRTAPPEEVQRQLDPLLGDPTRPLPIPATTPSPARGCPDC